MTECRKCGKEIETTSTIFWPFFIIFYFNRRQWRNEFCEDCAGLGDFLALLLFSILSIVAVLIIYIKFII